MENNKNILIIICFVALISIGLYFAMGNISDQAQNKNISTQEISNRENTNTPTDRTKTDLKISSECFYQSNILLKDYRNEQPDFDINMNNHVNIRQQKCFVEFNYRDNISNVIGTEVRDAYENKVLIGCLSGGPIKEKFCSIPEVSSINGQYQKLSAEEGEKIIYDYMNN